jgi:transcriptional regulator with XRE-family HTH domain
MINLGARLRELRHAKGMTLSDIQKRTGIFRCYVSRVELGYIVPQLPMMQKWAKALRVPLYEIFLPDGTSPQHGPFARLTRKDERLHKLLSRIHERDRRLFLAIATKMAKRGGKHGEPK